MKRYNRNDIVEIGRLTQGTSAAFIGLNTKTGRKGIYKENGCILGVSNDDVREKLASDMLKALDIDSANIDLVYDDELEENACFSNYVIEENEELVTPIAKGIDDESDDKIESFFAGYIEGVKQFSSDENLLKACRQNFYNYTYMCCIMDSYDLKTDNLPLVHNKDDNSYRPSPWFDFGTAFDTQAGQRSSFFTQMSTGEVMETLFENHYEDIKDISTKVHKTLTSEKLNELFSSDYLVETLDSSELSNMQARINLLLAKSKELEQRITNPSKFKLFISNLKTKLSNIFKSKQKLPEANTTPYISTSETKTFSENLSKLTNDTPEDVEHKPQDHTPPEL